jgi:hypothetical protein
MRLPILVPLLAVALAACASVHVTTDRDPKADFTRLHAWEWMPRTPPADPIRENTLVCNRIRDAIGRELSAKGFAAAEGGGADFRVGFETASKEHIDVQSWPSWCWGGFGRHRWWHGWSEDVTVTQYTVGTLVVGVVDPATGELLWRGTASGVVDEDSGSAERIDEAVTKLLAEFPPAARQRSPRQPPISRMR